VLLTLTVASYFRQAQAVSEKRGVERAFNHTHPARGSLLLAACGSLRIACEPILQLAGI